MTDERDGTSSALRSLLKGSGIFALLFMLYLLSLGPAAWFCADS